MWRLFYFAIFSRWLDTLSWMKIVPVITCMQLSVKYLRFQTGKGETQ